jgi:molecular chaperone DnaK
LDGASVSDINLPYIYVGGGEPVHMETKLTRDAFDKLVKPLIDRTQQPCLAAMKDAGVTTNDVRQVLLVGGMTRTPAVQELVKQLFGRAPSKAVNPDEVVASGAAVQGAVLAGDVKDIVLIDVTPLSLGTSDSQGSFVRIINRNTAIPAKHSKKFTTVRDGQSSIQCQVLQGERELAKHNKLLGEFTLPGIPPAKRGVPSIEISFEIDANGIVNATAKDAGTGTARNIRVQTSGGLSTAEVERMVADAERHAEEDKMLKDLLGARNAAEALCYSSEASLEEFDGKVTEDLAESIKDKVSALRTCLETTSPGEVDDVKKAVEDLQEKTIELQEVAFKIGESVYGRGGSSSSESEDKGEGEGEKKDA